MKKIVKSLLKRFNLEYKKKFNDKNYYINFSKESIKNKSFLNLCAGNFFHENWKNIDFSSTQYSHLQKNNFTNLNFQKKESLPFDDNSIELTVTRWV